MHRLPVSVRGLTTVGLAATLLAAVAAARTFTISPESYLEHVRYLASDDLAGRQPGTPGIEQAAEYIARQFKEAGLEPGGDGGTFFQEFEVTRGKKLDEAAAELKADGLGAEWKFGRDWTPLPFSDLGEVSGPLAFAGYGIKADDHDWNDFADFDAEGKILMIFRYEPASDDPEAAFGGKDPSRFSEFRSKAFTAHRRGAKALIIVNPPKRDGVPPGLFRFSEDLSRQTFNLPVIHVLPSVAEALLKRAGAPDLATLQTTLDTERRSISRDLDITLSIKPGLVKNVVKTRNVVGKLPGREPSEHILVGAHYDHLGNVPRQFERENDTPQIHNGADDNASGTAAVIELARALAKGDKPRRTVIFAAFSAEEMGLHGSKHFVAHAPVPIDSIKAMLNFDMVGRFDPEKFTIFGVPSAKEFEALVNEATSERDLTYRAPKSLMGNSDHGPFLAHDIPYLFPFTGMHRQYHRPEDDVDLINAEGAVRVVDLFADIAGRLANMTEGPTFTPSTGGSDDDAPPRPAFEESPDAPPQDRETASPGMPRVRLGIVPDYSSDGKPGVVAQTVTEGSAAKEGGIRDGDRIIRIDGVDIKDIYGYMAAMKDMKPGQTITVVVVRGDKEETLKIALKAPRRQGGRD